LYCFNGLFLVIFFDQFVLLKIHIPIGGYQIYKKSFKTGKKAENLQFSAF